MDVMVAPDGSTRRERRSAMKRRTTRRRASARRRTTTRTAERGGVTPILEELEAHRDTSPRLSGGDVDADWSRGESSGEETVGGSVATPDQDVVDELARALGVEQDADAELRTAGEILRERDSHRWQLEDGDGR
jgi:hypothetical protein